MGEASLLGLCCKSKGSRSSRLILLCDLLLKRAFAELKSNWESCKDVICSGIELALWMVLSVAKLPVLEVCHKIFSGSSTMIGGFGSE